MAKETLETHLRARLMDSRAMIGSLDINSDRVLLHFGAIGELARITLSIDDNEISIATPDELAADWSERDQAKRSRTPLDPAKPLLAVLVDGKFRIGHDGPEVILPEGEGFEDDTAAEFVSFPKDELIVATFDGEKLQAGPGGPEIELPENFYEYVGTALLTDDDDADGNSGGNEGGVARVAAPVAPAPEPHTDKIATQPLTPTDTPANAGKWLDFEKVKLEDIKAIAAAEGVELLAEDNTRREIAVKINAKRGATDPAAAK